MMRSFILLVGSVTVAWAQDTGRITGSVVDPSGAVVPKAAISVLLHGGATPAATTVSNAAGLFTVESLRPVLYDLTVDAPGFEKYQIENVKVNPSRDTDLPAITLQLAAAATSVSVTAGVETVQTATTEISTTVTNDQISRLPVGDRNPMAFLSTQAGV